MSEVKHTPTPWNVGYLGREIVSSVDTSVGKAYWQQDATHIVKCVNMHDELVATIESLLKVYSQPDEQICCNGRDCGCHGASIYQEAEHYALETLKKAGVL